MTTKPLPVSNITPTPKAQRFTLQRAGKHLNKLRWLCLWTVFGILLLIPMFHVYQTHALSHDYDLLTPSEQQTYDFIESFASLFSNEPEKDLDALKGSTWSGTLFGLKMSDPLAFASQVFASVDIHYPMLLALAIPLLVTLVLGRVFCGWICPATLLYELNDNIRAWLIKFNVPLMNKRFDMRIKYGVLGVLLVLCVLTGSVISAALYPPAVLGRELYYAIAMGGFSAGMLFFIATLLFDTLISQRGFCRYLCPGGALYSLLGRMRLVRIQRNVHRCNDCNKCNAACQFALQPMSDAFGQECNNCTACIAVCPTDALYVTLQLIDMPHQGPGRQSRAYKQNKKSAPITGNID